MAFLLRVYLGDEFQETEIKLEQIYTVGSTAKDGICFDRAGLPYRAFSVKVTEDGWTLSALNKVYENAFASVPLLNKFEDTIVLDEKNHVAITVYKDGPDYSRVVDVSKESNIIVGRSNSCEIAINSKRISGRHLELYRQGNSWCFRDLHSSNGTYLNGKLASCGQIHSEDSLSIGTCRFIVSETTIAIMYCGQITVNISHEHESKGVSSIEEPYPYYFKQSPRLKEEFSSETIELQSPPSIGGKPSISWLNVFLMPALTVAVMLGICLFVTGVMTMLYFSAPMMLIGAIMSVLRYKSEKKNYYATVQLRIDKYGDYLDEQVKNIERLLKEQRRVLNNDNPSLLQCVHLAEGPDRTLWDRRYRDSDYMTLRLGTGEVPASIQIRAPKQMLSLEVDTLANRPQEICQKYTHVDGCPITIELGKYLSCGIVGDRNRCVTLGKNLIVQAATHHAYDDLRIVILCDQDEKDNWSFCKWLPHVYDDTHRMRYFSDTPQKSVYLLKTLEEILVQRELENNSAEFNVTTKQHPFYLFVCASASVASHPIMRFLVKNDEKLGVGALFLFDSIASLPKECQYIADLSKSPYTVYLKDHASSKQNFMIDPMPIEQYENFSRNLAPLRIELKGEEAALPTSVSFLQGYHAKTPQMLNLKENWNNAFPERSMAVPIGVKSNGDSFYFDIHEKHHGPHGMVAGMTGSGKSEMVQSWILSMAIRFPPSAVSFVLIDFKGTGLLLPFKNLPHLVGTISDLDTSIGRNLIALENELNRRKALLDHYQVRNISDYRKLLHTDQATEPLPYLFIVIDEFAEFRLRFPDFMQAVDSVFAIGRTLGVHILLLTQKPGSIVDEKMTANTSFRWCLKVASSSDSREMLRHPDAAKITNPGRSYVQVGEDEVYEEIQSFWSGAPYNPYRELNLQRSTKVSVVDLYGNRVCYEPEKTTGYRSEKSEIDAIVEYIDDFARKNNIPRAGAIWTTKLPEKVTLRDVLQIAFDGENWSQNEQSLRPAVGKLDDPRSQSQYPLYLDFLEFGHTAIYGAPGSGKTTLLHTIIMSLALSYPPDIVNMYLMDFGGGSLNLFKNIPHVGGVIIGGDDEMVQKLAMILTNEVARRKRLMADHGLVSVASYREVTGEKLPYIVLLLDNFAPVLDMYPDLDTFFQMLARDGSSCGVFFVVTGNNTNSISYRINQNIKFSIALQMPDRNDYTAIVGRTNGLEPENHPGRGLIRSDPPLEFQAALPGEGRNEVERVANIRNLAALMNEKWSGQRAASIPVVPEVVRLSDYPCSTLFLGVSYKDAVAREVDIENTQYFIISAAYDCSKTVQIIAQQIINKVPLQEVIAYGMADIRGVHSLSANEFDQAIGDLMPVLQDRKQTASGSRLPSEQYPYVVVLIGDLQDCFDKVSDRTIQRLTSIVTLGAGLNVILMVSGTPNSIGKLYHGGDSFTVNLVRKSSALLIGGSVSGHGVFETDLAHSAASSQMEKGEAYLIKNKTAEKIKFVQQ